ncbi:PAAR domain-containing protein [Acinetobacter faecalis]|uniref:PAAR domain-containing protein n=1 Tax=Acinetobacter faecalis TaxID=2665161 RepID=UPI002A90AC87|nr:PAAR domain-containing protein [Acinetobacter faecalis]MDY6457537.1 PAAR domain-containing protein [Acinetobacter faecalis]
MATPIFLCDLPLEIRSKLSPQEIEQISYAESLYWDNKPKTIYHLALNGVKTRNGGLVKGRSGMFLDNIPVALVGDEVIYEDGTTSKIISGAGFALMEGNLPVALVGSRLENGDEIIEALDKGVEIAIYKDEPLVDGFLVDNWVYEG